MSDMTREEAIDEIKRWTPILLNSGQCTEKTSEAQDIAISALSADGEYIKKEEIINHLTELGWISDEPFNEVSIPKEVFDEVPTYSFPDLAEINGEWYPITSRPITEEELKDYEGWIDYLHPEETMILDCHLPDSGAEVLITENGYVGIDTFYNEGGECYFESANIDEVTAWMPLPEPYQEGEGTDEKRNH